MPDFMGLFDAADDPRINNSQPPAKNLLRYLGNVFGSNDSLKDLRAAEEAERQLRIAENQYRSEQLSAVPAYRSLPVTEARRASFDFDRYRGGLNQLDQGQPGSFDARVAQENFRGNKTVNDANAFNFERHKGASEMLDKGFPGSFDAGVREEELLARRLGNNATTQSMLNDRERIELAKEAGGRADRQLDMDERRMSDAKVATGINAMSGVVPYQPELLPNYRNAIEQYSGLSMQPTPPVPTEEEIQRQSLKERIVSALEDYQGDQRGPSRSEQASEQRQTMPGPFDVDLPSLSGDGSPGPFSVDALAPLRQLREMVAYLMSQGAEPQAQGEVELRRRPQAYGETTLR